MLRIYSRRVDIFIGYDPVALTLAALALVFAGWIKGIIGLALPIVGLSLLAMIFPIHFALAVMVLPICASNVWQALRTPDCMAQAKRFWPIIVALTVTMAATSGLVVALDDHLLRVLIGVVLTIVGIANLTTDRFVLPSRYERPVSIVAGLVAGVFGGVSTIWGPPLLTFLISLRLSKDVFIGAVGFIWLAGSIPFLIAFIANGVLNGGTLPVSALAIIPVIGGMWFGEKLRNKLDDGLYRRVLLIAIILMGLNLIRSGLQVHFS